MLTMAMLLLAGICGGRGGLASPPASRVGSACTRAATFAAMGRSFPRNLLDTHGIRGTKKFHSLRYKIYTLKVSSLSIISITKNVYTFDIYIIYIFYIFLNIFTWNVILFNNIYIYIFLVNIYIWQTKTSNEKKC